MACGSLANAPSIGINHLVRTLFQTPREFFYCWPTKQQVVDVNAAFPNILHFRACFCFGSTERKLVTRVLYFFLSPFQLAYAIINVPTIPRFCVWSMKVRRLNARNRYAPSAPMIFLAAMRPDKCANTLLDIFPWMACVSYGRNGPIPLHVACDPQHCGDVEFVRQLLKLFPEAVHERDCDDPFGCIPLNYVFSTWGLARDGSASRGGRRGFVLHV